MPDCPTNKTLDFSNVTRHSPVPIARQAVLTAYARRTNLHGKNPRAEQTFGTLSCCGRRANFDVDHAGMMMTAEEPGGPSCGFVVQQGASSNLNASCQSGNQAQPVVSGIHIGRSHMRCRPVSCSVEPGSTRLSS